MQVAGSRDVSPEGAWVASLVAGVVAVVGGALAFPERVYWGFLWRYFWGPVKADAEGASCVAYLRDTGEVVSDPAAGCAGVSNAYVAEPGYTAVSTLGYIVVLGFALVGVYLLLQRFDLDPIDWFYFALVPWMLFGGLFRVVEDSFVAARRAGVDPALEFPWSAALISPFIYVTVFVITLVAFLLAKWAERRGVTDTYQYPLAAMGIATVVATSAYLAWLAATTDYVSSYPLVLVTVFVLSTAFAVGIYAAIDRYRPEVHRGTGLMGLGILWAHAVDGVANVLSADWTAVFGLPGDGYSAKHVVNRLIIDVTNSAQPAWLTDLIGDSWTFLVVKLVVATAILAVFDDEFFEETPFYAVVLIIVVTAVGLGPGTRDVTRVALGI